MEESKAERDEMIKFAKKIADKIVEKYSGDERFLIMDLVKWIMEATVFYKKEPSA